MVMIQVKVKPNAKTSSLVEGSDGVWQARLKAPPADGKANQELIALVAQVFECPRSAVSIAAGKTGRLKRVRIDR